MKYIVRILFVFGVVVLFAGNGRAESLTASARVSPYTKLVWERLQSEALTEADFARVGLQKSGPRLMISLLVTKQPGFSLRSVLAPLKGSVGTETPQFATVTLPVQNLPDLLKLRQVRYVENFLPAKPKLDVSVPVIQANRVHLGQSPLKQGYQGKGVVVGIVDSGIDVTHPAFQNPDGTTRILYVWDQTQTGPKPHFFNYGAEFSAADINAGRCTEIDGPGHYGHGTHVSGIAAGNGAPSGKYVGVAPAADLIEVKTDFNFNHIVDAVEYVFRLAGARHEPAVVNLSLSTQQGPHDGTTTAEQLLDSKVRAGQILVVAASNEGDKPIHVSYSLNNDEKATGFVAYANDPHDVYVDVWYRNGNLDFALAGLDKDLNLLPSSQWVTPGNRLSQKTYAANGTTYGIYTIDATETNNPFNGLRHVVFEITNNNGSYNFTSTAITWVMKVRGTGNLHAWVYGDNGEFDSFSGSLDGLNFVGGDSDYTVGMPGTAPRVITVGAFNTKNQWTNKDNQTYHLTGNVPIGDIADFSSIGPTLDGRIKPDVTAPGQVIASAMSGEANLLATQGPRVLPGEKYFVLQGTSMASPHVAGTVALMLEKDPGLTPEMVKSDLIQTATSDSYTGSIPNNTWGYGKVNAFAALSLLTTGIASPEKERNAPQSFELLGTFPNPFSPSRGNGVAFVVRLPSEKAARIRIVNVLGQMVKEIPLRPQSTGSRQIVWNGRTTAGGLAPAGIYFVQLSAGGQRRVKKILLVR